MVHRVKVFVRIFVLYSYHDDFDVFECLKLTLLNKYELIHLNMDAMIDIIELNISHFVHPKY